MDRMDRKWPGQNLTYLKDEVLPSLHMVPVLASAQSSTLKTTSAAEFIEDAISRARQHSSTPSRGAWPRRTRGFQRLHHWQVRDMRAEKLKAKPILKRAAIDPRASQTR